MSADETRIGRPAPPKDEVYPHRDVTEKIIGAAFEVHRELGPGFLERVYETALARELATRGVPVAQQSEIGVGYKGDSVGVYYADVFVDGKVICEIKVVAALTADHEAQILHYLKATGVEVGLLLNFGTERVQVKRFARTR